MKNIAIVRVTKRQDVTKTPEIVLVGTRLVTVEQYNLLRSFITSINKGGNQTYQMIQIENGVDTEATITSIIDSCMSMEHKRTEKNHEKNVRAQVSSMKRYQRKQASKQKKELFNLAINPSNEYAADKISFALSESIL